MGGTILNRTCLKSTYTLRRQLIVSYGCTAFFTIGIVVILATLAAQHAGKTVKDQTSSLLESQVTSGLAESELQTASLFAQKFQTIRGSSALLSEIIRDRIVGYPDEFEDDRHVPFIDIETGQNAYPLRGPRLPRDYEVVSNLTPDNMVEHTQERGEALRPFVDMLSTSSASFFFQGNCDPVETDPSGMGYIENCTGAHNDPRGGGVIQPVATLGGLAEKANDIGIFLKPLFEAEPSVIQLAVYFFNSGAGAALLFPATKMNSASNYVSSGCEWMREANPVTGLPFGGDEEIARCHPDGTEVTGRYYNPMERDFCRDQALNPGEIRIFGPYLDVVWGQWRMTIGQAVFDRKTGEFLACTAHDLNLQLAEDLVQSVSTNTRSNAVLIRLDGTVVAGSGVDHSQRNETLNIVDTDFIDQQSFDKLTSIRFWENDLWDSSNVKASLKNNLIRLNNRILACVPVPFPPDEFVKSYAPDFYVLVEADVNDVFGVRNQIDAAIEDEVADLLFNSILIGMGGLIVFLLVVAFVSHILTRPLKWMETTAWKIVNHADKRVSEDLVMPHPDHEEDDPLVRCSPKTEIGELVTEFQAMIRGFSGTGASRVAPSKVDEVKNFVTWKDDFRQFYQLNQTMEERIKEEMSQKAQAYGRRISIGKRSRNNSSYGPTASEIIANMSEASQVSEEESTTFRSAEIRRDPTSNKQFGRTDSSTLFKRPLTRTNLGSNLGQEERSRQSRH